MSYTPGPWTIEILTPDQTEDGEFMTAITCGADVDGKEGAILAKINRWSYGKEPPTVESEFNARLIAASPDLIAACKIALKALHAFDGYTGKGADACNILRSAIAKVERNP